ncbi:MAG: hypothetical protein V1905_01440 [bacterium]
MVKRINAGRKYYFILFILAIVAVGFIIFLNRQFIMNIPDSQPVIPAVNKTEAKVVFDVYSLTDNVDPEWIWTDSVVVPRIIDSGDLSAENAFSEYVFDKIANANNDSPDIKKGYIKMKERLSENEANDSLAPNVNIEPNGLSGDSQTYIREYMLKNNIFSGLFYFYSTGGAHPVDSSVMINYDLKNMREITIDDILLISGGNLIDYLNTEQNKLYSAAPGEPENLNCSRDELMPSGFYVTESSLVIMTSPSRLNSYCSPSFEFEYSAIKDIINKNGPLLRVLNNIK